VPFRQGHDIIGQVLREAERQSKPYTQLSLDDLRNISPVFAADFYSALSVDGALAAKSVPGGTALDSVRAAISNLEQRMSSLAIKSKLKKGEAA
jgi:argininosuccinate lyase